MVLGETLQKVDHKNPTIWIAPRSENVSLPQELQGPPRQTPNREFFGLLKCESTVMCKHDISAIPSVVGKNSLLRQEILNVFCV